MAHVEKFSNLTIPMVWFEIAMEELPVHLQNRFSLYLNILPMVEKVGFYGSFVLGALLSIFAVTQVALRTSKSMAAQSCKQQFRGNLVYSPCEEKESKKSKHVVKVTQVDEFSKCDDDNNSDCMVIISRSHYELEDDDALSDIEYNDLDGESTSSSSIPVC